MYIISAKHIYMCINFYLYNRIGTDEKVSRFQATNIVNWYLISLADL